MAYEGNKFSSQKNHKLKEVYLATVGDDGLVFPQTNALASYESMKLAHLGPDSELINAETEGQMTDLGGEDNFAWKVGAKVNSLEASILTWMNTVRLARGTVGLYGLNMAGQYINLVPQTNNDFTGSPDGATISGLTLNGTKRTISKTERKIEYNLQGLSLPAQYAWLYNSTQLSAYTVGTGSGTGRGLVDVSAVAYKRPPGFYSMTFGGAAFGFFEECTLTEEIIGSEIQNNIFVCNDVKLTLSFAGRQLSGPQALAHGTYAMADQAIVGTTFAGETFTFASGALRGKYKLSSGHKGPRIEAELTGTIPFNLSDASPDHISAAAATAITYTYL